MGLNTVKIEIIVSNNTTEYLDKQQFKTIKTDYFAQVFSTGDTESDFVLIFTPAGLEQEAEDTVIHELLHILFWNFIEQMKSLILLTELHIDKRKRLIAELNNLEHKWIKVLVPAIKKP
uniref:Uncharacterized protein n=1 Tax=viral metagenome TaxID=1070528 RepID=A0A6H1ZFB3_9ZZZZ